MKKLTPREQAFVALGPFIILGLFHLFLRVLPLEKAVRGDEAQVARLEGGLVAPRNGARDPEAERLHASRDGLRATLAHERDRLAALERGFPADEGAALAAASDLAARSGVLVRESSPYRPTDDAHARPRRRFVLVARFAALRAFVAGLASLATGPIRVERFELEAVPLRASDAAADPHALVATLVVVL